MPYLGYEPSKVAVTVGQGVIDATHIQDASITTADLGNDSVTPIKIDDDGTGFQMGSLGLGTAVSGSEKLTVGGTASFSGTASLGDLDIIPTSSNVSVIKHDSGSGSLTLQGDQVNIKNRAGNETGLSYNDGGGVILSHNSKATSSSADTTFKIETTSGTTIFPVLDFVSSHNSVGGKIRQDGSDVITIDNDQDVTFADDITVSGNAIFAGSIVKTGDLTVDVSGDIILDADDEHVFLKDGGTTIGNIDLGSQNITIRNSISNADLIFRGNDGGTEVEAMRINYSGNNVGIGTSSIGAKLHVADNRSTAYSTSGEPAETIIAHNKNGTDDSGVNNYASLSFHVADGATSQGFINYVRTGNNTGEFTFSQRNGSSSYAEQMRITSDGKFGFGSIAPAQKYEFRGDNHNDIMRMYDSANSDNIWILRNEVHSGTSSGRLQLLKGDGDGVELNGHDGRTSFIKSPLAIGGTTASEKLHIHDGDILVDSGRGVRANGGNEMIRFHSSDGVKINSGGSQRYLITTEGEFLHTTSRGGLIGSFRNDHGSIPYGIKIDFDNATPNNTNQYFITCQDSTNDKFVVHSNGDVDSRTNSYSGISDERLKENIVNASPKLDELNKVRIVNYNFKDDPDKKQLGVVAQELQKIFPKMINEVGEDKTLSVKYSIFVPMLIKAVQELSAKVKVLENA